MKETNVEDHGGYIFSNEENMGNLNVSLAIGTKPSMWTFYLQLVHKCPLIMQIQSIAP